MKSPKYPITHQVKRVDDYHGVRVPDPYQWLEDETSSVRAAWIAAQQAITEEHLSTIPFRAELRARLEQLAEYPRYYELIRQGPYITFKKNDGLQNQLVQYVQRSLSGPPEILVDPLDLSPDGTIRTTTATLSKDARYLGYSLSHGGGDWEEYFVKDMVTMEDLPDRLRWVKCSTIAWRGDGFYYSRYPEPCELSHILSRLNEYHQVWYHRVGTPQSADTLVYEDNDHPLRLHLVVTTQDERFAVLSIFDGAAGRAGNAIWVLDTEQSEPTFSPLVTSFDEVFRVIDNEQGRLLVHTNRGAPNWRVVLVDPASPDEQTWTEIIPQREVPLERVSAAGTRLFGIYRENAIDRVYVFDRTGKQEGEVELPGIGSVGGFVGQRQDQDVFWTFSSFTSPTTVYLYDIARRTSSVFEQSRAKFDPERYETRQVFYPSKDGIRIPMLVVHRRGLVFDGRSPAVLSGYGGFGMSVGSSYDPFLVALLERGVVFALANLRGGGEYGEIWHHAGWRDKKQTTFDDCIAAAEWLQANGYTSRDRCALMGASGAGLLVGAVMTQRPDLFAVTLPGAATMDMLRFHHFTVASHWVAEHGSSDDPAMFPILLAYSPLHNVTEGVRYPATLVTTYEQDDRVVPAHSFKFVATLQNKGTGPGPYLIRIDSKSGHGAVSLPKALDERADLYAFLLAHLPGAEVSAPGPVRLDRGESIARIPSQT
ncbi:MAG: prolyl oligopeptidase family serine peptidase [Gemmatimonadales bacterium]